ncbi:DNA ligase D [Salipaludibacillus neizhouensis]|uniref:DNA ligase (ATP) n=2 Tax=Salipaludibacillus neizhouensis TaxID=885475 RepID=A0A3A9KB18_9BACI|nr:DNA ligase D [Salipaludibacillus neizhouensis]RKL67950.1 DNA ligase D [Salipaludibacillus neizhouensis]
MKPMLLTPVEEFPETSGWIYEAKYDGFRCLLHWREKTPELSSRNGKNLNANFPEIVQFCEKMYEEVKPFLPLSLDGEIVFLLNPWRSKFSEVQRRGRMKSKDVISKHAASFPCKYIAFDVLTLKGESLRNKTLPSRKKQMSSFFKKTHLPHKVDAQDSRSLQAIEVFKNWEELWHNIVVYHGEGAIAKRKTSTWESGKRTTQWLKKKHWRMITVALSTYNPKNGYFDGGVYDGEKFLVIVQFKHGLAEEEEKTLRTLFQKNGVKQSDGSFHIPPSVCANIACIDFDGKHLREPRFHSFQFETEPSSCSRKQMEKQLFALPETVPITSPDKPVWPEQEIHKDDYLLYLQHMSPYLLPFLKDRLLTVIRYPHGADGELFYQKNSPDYAPDFVQTETIDEIDYIICNELETLLWLGNQLALEFHTPFETIGTSYPTEIVLDLDPPSMKEFSLAVEAAVRMKEIFDEFQLESFVKTSGRKGLQLYIPLPESVFSYEDTRIFTSFVCKFLCEQEADWFTIERMKKNRGNRLYLDYIQHDKGKTIITPYSPRGHEAGLIATPLFWPEVDSGLTPYSFTLPAVIERVAIEGDPFRLMRHVDNEVAFKEVLEKLREF